LPAVFVDEEHVAPAPPRVAVAVAVEGDVRRVADPGALTTTDRPMTEGAWRRRRAMRLGDPQQSSAWVGTRNDEFDEAQLAAVSFLARYSGRTLDAYRQDLRGFFQWATDYGIAVLEASRAHIELFRTWIEDRGLAASTIDRRLSTVCGFYRFAHIDGRIRSNPAQYVRRPQVHPSDARAWIARSSAGFSSPRSGSTVTTPRSPCCSA
jgi:integrase